MVNAFSVDLEDWFCVNNMRSIIRFEDWASQEHRITHNTQILLDILDLYNVRATFFVLGWIAERYPDLVKEVAKRGHEIACHGYSHRLLVSMEPEEFRGDLRKAVHAIVKCDVDQPLGFRAPCFDINEETLWALPILEDEGFVYDSSIYPMGFHPDYGLVKSPLHIHQIGNKFLEFPLCCVECCGIRIPCSGGAYFRIYPFALTKSLLKKCNKSGRPFVFYIHPWEIDPEQPRIDMPLIKRQRHYTNLSKTLKRLIRLVDSFEFAPVIEVIQWQLHGKFR